MNLSREEPMLNETFHFSMKAKFPPWSPWTSEDIAR